MAVPVTAENVDAAWNAASICLSSARTPPIARPRGEVVDWLSQLANNRPLDPRRRCLGAGVGRRTSRLPGPPPTLDRPRRGLGGGDTHRRAFPPGGRRPARPADYSGRAERHRIVDDTEPNCPLALGRRSRTRGRPDAQASIGEPPPRPVLERTPAVDGRRLAGGPAHPPMDRRRTVPVPHGRTEGRAGPGVGVPAGRRRVAGRNGRSD